MQFLPENWSEIFQLQNPLLELVIRGTVLYFVILAFIRLMPRRTTAGDLAVMDLIFFVLIAGSAAHSFGEYTSISDGLVLVATLMIWNYLLNYLSYRFKAIDLTSDSRRKAPTPEYAPRVLNARRIDGATP